ACVVGDLVYLAYVGTYFPNFLVAIALVLALAGLPTAPAIRRRRERLLAEAVADDSTGELWSAFAVLVAFLAFFSGTIFPSSPYNEELRQAVAFLQGHISIDAPKSFIEHAQIGSYSYALHPPLSAFLMLPLAAIWGMDVNQTEFTVVVGAIAVALSWR